MRLSIFVWMFVIVVASFMLYKVKYQVQGLKNDIAATSRELEKEREALHVVNAEWAYLNRPVRLEMLAAKYLASEGVTVNQIAEVEEIPFPNQRMAAINKEDGIKTVSLNVDKDGR